jgi:hypothetical protein
LRSWIHIIVVRAHFGAWAATQSVDGRRSCGSCHSFVLGHERRGNDELARNSKEETEMVIGERNRRRGQPTALENPRIPDGVPLDFRGIRLALDRLGWTDEIRRVNRTATWPQSGRKGCPCFAVWLPLCSPPPSRSSRRPLPHRS